MRAVELLFEEEQRKIDTPEFRALLTPGLSKLGALYGQRGKDLRIVGGAVRDLLLGKTAKDIDLASDALPQESLELLKRAGIRTIETGLQHGTITAIVDGEEYEITTLRIDTEHTGRHATVEFTKDWSKDAERRDLTFNAMSLDLSGTLYDYFGGEEDLKKGKAQFVGSADERIKEDYLRILRYFRFKGRLEQPKFDKETLEAIANNAKGLEQISGERIWMEFRKILEGDHTVKILKKMVATGVDNYINLPMGDFKEFSRAKKTLNMAPALLAALLKNEAEVDSIVANWKMSAVERELTRFIVINRDKPFNLESATAMWTDPKIKDVFVRILAYYLGEPSIAQELKTKKKPVFPVSGKDLMALGMKAGPEMGTILKQLNQHWKETGYTMSKEELLQWGKIEQSNV